MRRLRPETEQTKSPLVYALLHIGQPTTLGLEGLTAARNSVGSTRSAHRSNFESVRLAQQQDLVCRSALGETFGAPWNTEESVLSKVTCHRVDRHNRIYESRRGDGCGTPHGLQGEQPCCE